jgi:hypothetical protein
MGLLAIPVVGGPYPGLAFQRPQGPPCEVTNAQLSSAISGTSNNTNAVSTLDTPFADPDSEALRQKMNEFILAARR